MSGLIIKVGETQTQEIKFGGKMNITWDRETTGLLDETAIDYTKLPYTLRDSFKTHCIVVEEHDTNKIIAFYDGPKYIFDGRDYIESGAHGSYELKDYMPLDYEHRSLKDFKTYILNTRPNKVVAHNQINFDLLVGKLEEDMPYTVEPDTWCGLAVEFEDTLVTSKTLNPDRFGGHSLDSLSEKAGVRKIAFRKDMAPGTRFLEFAADMLYYCIYDVKANTAVYKMLEKEKLGWDWADALSLEKAVAELITRQSHRGFVFNKELAEWCVTDLDEKMDNIRQLVEPLIPAKAITKSAAKDFTPPKVQFKQDGEHSAYLIKFIKKHNGKILDQYKVELFGQVLELPLPQEPLVKKIPATLADTTHIKEWLVSLGWQPTQFKDRDLTVDSKKRKLSKDKVIAAIDRYVSQTKEST